MANINGTNTNDTITGTSDNDIISGGAGDDQINGDQGDDVIFAGDGHDIVHGGDGNDVIHGGGDNDELFGDAGADTFFIDEATDASSGILNTTVYGGSGGVDDDTLNVQALLDQGFVVNHLVMNPETNGEAGYNGQVTLNNPDTGQTININFNDIENVMVPCFTPGTMITTLQGERPVEELRAGDFVVTRDNGLQEISWVGQKALGGQDLAVTPDLRPVLVRAGALGRGLPMRDMVVSPNHRLLITGERPALYFDETEVLAAAKHLVDGKGIQRLETAPVTYVHFMCERHEVVLSNGSWTESLQPGDQALKGVGAAAQNEIFALFPELANPAARESFTAARRVLKRHEAIVLTK
jgi:hypothetical protein